MRVIDRLKAQVARQNAFYSFEYFAPRSDSGRRHLQGRISRMADMGPLFVDIACPDLELAIRVAKEALLFAGTDVMIHVGCGGGKVLTALEFRAALEKIKAAGIRNLLISSEWCSAEESGSEVLKEPSQFVRLIRSEYNDLFTIVVRAFPEGERPDKIQPPMSRSENREKCLAQLVDCVKAGADFCLSEVIFDTAAFLDFVRQAREAGVPRSVPIVPSLMLVQNLESFRSVVQHLGLSVPERVEEKLQDKQNDPVGVQDAGIELAESMCRELLNSGSVYGFHFCTMNLEYSVRTLLEDHLQVTPTSALPWRTSALPKREEEDVRPIFWANRPKSYLLRTDSWDKFPSGRWGKVLDDSAICFSELNKDDPAFLGSETYFERNDIKKAAWGEAPISREEIFDVFVGFMQGRVPFLPWFEESLDLETNEIQKELIEINRGGFLTINSQPRVNAAPSNDPRFGWGPPGGFVYQKAYLEFFTSPRLLSRLIQLLQTPEYAEGRQLVYHAVDHKGNSYSNSVSKKPCAVTWGVFPGKEVLQPTIVDPTAFVAWKDEAFALWLHSWAAIYEEDSPSWELIHDIHDEYFLVNIVDNDFANGNIFEIFDRLLKN